MAAKSTLQCHVQSYNIEIKIAVSFFKIGPLQRAVLASIIARAHVVRSSGEYHGQPAVRVEDRDAVLSLT